MIDERSDWHGHAREAFYTYTHKAIDAFVNEYVKRVMSAEQFNRVIDDIGTDVADSLSDVFFNWESDE